MGFGGLSLGFVIWGVQGLSISALKAGCTHTDLVGGLGFWGSGVECMVYRKVDIRLHGKGIQNSHRARPVNQDI